MKLEELIKKTKLDRITGTRSVVREGEDFIALDESDKKLLNELDNITGKTLYLIEHGYSPVVYFIRDLEDNNSPELRRIYKSTDKAVDMIDFGEFKIYRVVDLDLLSYSISISWRYSGNVYIDAKRVDLPFLKTITPGKDSRIYIIMDEEHNIYKLPELIYPSPIKDFFKWLKKKKKISIKVKAVFDRNETFDNYPGWAPKRNIKKESEIIGYIEDVKNNNKYGWLNGWINKLKNIKDINITQEDINLYISEANNRYKVYR